MTRAYCHSCRKDVPHRVTHLAVHAYCRLCQEREEVHPAECEGLFQRGGPDDPLLTYAEISAGWGMGHASAGGQA